MGEKQPLDIIRMINTQDRSNLPIFGQGEVPGLNNNEELDSHLKKIQALLETLFTDQTVNHDLVARAQKEIDKIDQVENPTDEQSSAKDLLAALIGLAQAAQRNNPVEFTLRLKRLAEAPLQDAFARAKDYVGTLFDGQLTEIFHAIFELTRILYYSKNGEFYQTAEQKMKLEKMRAHAQTVTVS